MGDVTAFAVAGHILNVCVLLQMAEHLVTTAYENGVNLFDTAEVYASGRQVTLFSSFSLPSDCLFSFLTVSLL